MSLLSSDRRRGGCMPLYQVFLRWAQSAPPVLRIFNKAALALTRFVYHTEISSRTRIGEGLYIGHPYGITVNARAVIGRNCNIHKGVTIGQQNRGRLKGAPVIGDEVWIGVGAVVVGAITVGDDVLIAPGAYVNRDVPPHSIALGNPATVIPRERATEGYIENKV